MSAHVEEQITKHEEVREMDLLHAEELEAYQMLVDELSAENERLKQEIVLLTPVEGSM